MLALPLCLLSSCAWSNVANRPVWNAFEATLVPDNGGLFVATLPVTIPLGLGSIVADTIVAHPLQVLDDAYDDAAQLWDPKDMEFEDAYYTEMAFLPVRTVATPLAFTGSFLGRVLFDIRAPTRSMTEAERLAAYQLREAKREQVLRDTFVAWLRKPSASGGAVSITQWHDSFDEPMREALLGNAERRMFVHRGMLRAGLSKLGSYDGEVGLRDPDPVVSYTCAKHWPRAGVQPSDALLATLRQDPVESVRLAVESRFAQ